MNVTAIKKLVSLRRDVSGGLKADIESLRGEIADRRSDLSTIEAMAVPPEAAKASKEAWLDSLIERGMFPVSCFSTGRASSWPIIHQDNAARIIPALMAAAMREQLSAYLDAAIEDDYEGRLFGSDAEREQRLAETHADIRMLEIAEERLIRAAEAAGLSILRRGDANPEIVIAADGELEL